jgi:hypothetical protein
VLTEKNGGRNQVKLLSISVTVAADAMKFGHWLPHIKPKRFCYIHFFHFPYCNAVTEPLGRLGPLSGFFLVFFLFLGF